MSVTAAATAKPIIILLRGYSGSGKDTVGKILINKHGFRRFAFADGLKQMIAHEYGCSLATLHSQEGKQEICEETNETWRQVMLRVALEAKEADPDVFARMCATEIRMAGIPSRVVITDWRFPNECDVLKRAFPAAHFIRAEVVRYDQSPVDDESEYALADEWADYVIENRRDMVALEAAVEEFVAAAAAA